jgi:hypothetical protein
MAGLDARIGELGFNQSLARVLGEPGTLLLEFKK